MKALHLILAAVLSLAAVTASAQRLPIPIVNHENVAAQRGNGQPASAEAVRKALLVAAEATGRTWVIAETAPGRMVATYQVRTHTVVTDIRYDAGQFSVSYRDSVNMKYAPGGPGGTGVIHPFYNQWVQEFIQAVRVELNKI